MTHVRGQKGFFVWLKTNMPEVYREVSKEFRGASTLNGFGILNTDPVALSTEQPASKTFAQTIQDIANIAAQAYLTKEQLSAQRKVLDMQLQRAQQGLPPLDIDPVKYGLPSPSLQVGMTADTKQWLMIGGIGVALLFGLSQMGRRK